MTVTLDEVFSVALLMGLPDVGGRGQLSCPASSHELTRPLRPAEFRGYISPGPRRKQRSARLYRSMIGHPVSLCLRGFHVPHGCLLLFLEQVHIQIATALLPPFMCLDSQRPDQPQAARRVRKGPYEMGSAFDLLVDPLQQVA